MISCTCLADDTSEAIKATTKALGKVYKPEIKRIEKKTRTILIKRMGIDPEILANTILVIDILNKQQIQGKIGLGKGKHLTPFYNYYQKRGNISFTMTF